QSSVRQDGGDDAALRCAFRGVEPDAFFQETRLEPRAQDALVHGNVLEQPGMTDAVEAGGNIPFQDPSWSMWVAKEEMTLLDGIRTAACLAKAIGMAVGQGFGDGIEAKQVQSLHGPIGHRRNAERTLLTVALGNVEAPQRLRPITAPTQERECRLTVF